MVSATGSVETVGSTGTLVGAVVSAVAAVVDVGSVVVSADALAAIGKHDNISVSTSSIAVTRLIVCIVSS